MNTVDKNITRAGRQLRPEIIQNLIRQGDVYNNATSAAGKKEIAQQYQMTPAERHQRSSIAGMFGSESGFDLFFVSRLPWKVLELLSQKSKDLMLRKTLANLVLYAVEREWAGVEPSPYSVIPDIAFIDTLIGNLETHRDSIERLHAYMRKEKLEQGKDGTPLTEKERELLEGAAPDLRLEIYGPPVELEVKPLESPETVIAVPAHNTPLIVEMVKTQLNETINEFFQQVGIESPQSIKAKIDALKAEIDELELRTTEQGVKLLTWREKAQAALERVGELQAAALLLAESANGAINEISALVDALKEE
jgi:hypothetical protein